jgi:hypothetical protein
MIGHLFSCLNHDYKPGGNTTCCIDAGLCIANAGGGNKPLVRPIARCIWRNHGDDIAISGAISVWNCREMAATIKNRYGIFKTRADFLNVSCRKSTCAAESPAYGRFGTGANNAQGVPFWERATRHQGDKAIHMTVTEDVSGMFGPGEKI